MRYAEGHLIPHMRYAAAYADFYADFKIRIHIYLEYIAMQTEIRIYEEYKQHNTNTNCKA